MAEDLTGKKFGRLKVLRPDSKRGRRYWICKCNCGRKKVVYDSNLRTGNTSSCGCFRREVSHRIGKASKGRRHTAATCRRISKALQGHIVSGETRRKLSRSNRGKIRSEEFRRKISEASKIHGLHRHPLYGVWHSMRQRCYNENCKAFKHYGGRGITICYAWREFQKFYDWAMRNGYKRGLSIDRRNNSKGYFPDNCRWTTYKVQNNNRRNRKRKMEEKKCRLVQL